MAFINFINAEGGNVEELEQQISALTEELNVVTDEYGAVIDRSVSSVTIPDGTQTVGESAFNGCSALTEATITSNVSALNSKSFANNRSLSTITFEGDTPPTVAEDAFSMLPKDVEVEVPEGYEDAYSGVVETIKENTIPWVTATDPNGSAYTFTYVDGTVPYRAFRSWGSCKLEMSNNITHLGWEAFNNMQALSSLTLSTGITIMEGYAMANLGSYRGHISLPNIVTIGNYAITTGVFDSIEFGQNLQSLGDGAISSTNLSAVTFHTANPSAITFGENAILSSQSDGELRVDTGLTGFDLDEWIKFKITHLPNWSLTDLAGNNIEGHYMMFVSGDTMEIYRPSGTTISSSDQDMPQGVYDKIYTVGMEEIDDNCFMNTQAIEYYFDTALTKSKCSPFWGSNSVKIVFASNNLDLQNFDARLFSTAWGNPPVSSITFYNSECPTKHLEYYAPNSAAASGTIYAPVGSKNWHKLIESGLTSAWTVWDVADTSHELNPVTITTSATTESYYYYQSPPNAGFVFRTDIIKAKIEGFSYSGGQLFQGCSNLSSVTIDGHIRLEGNVFYDCSNLTEITWLNETSPSVDGSGQFDGVPSAGTMYIDTGVSGYSYSTWVNFQETYLPDWAFCDLSGNPIEDTPVTPYCEIDNTDWIRDYGVNIKVGTSPAPIRITYNDEQTLTIVDGRILYMQPVGEFSVNYDAENDDIVIIENSSQEPITQQQQEAIDEYMVINYDSDYGFINYVFWDIDTVTVDNDDYTGLYTYCEYMEDMA